MVAKRKIIKFNKQFAEGEQNVILDDHGDVVVVKEPVKVYNHTKMLVDLFKQEVPNADDDVIYGKNGLVDTLAPLQVQYNKVAALRFDYLENLAHPYLFVEYGAQYLQKKEDKVIVYSEDSEPPFYDAPKSTDMEALGYNETLREIGSDMQHVLDTFIKLFGNK